MKLFTLEDLLVIDNTILDDYVLDSRIVRKDLNDYIFFRLGQREPVFTDTRRFKQNLNSWFKVHQQNISKLVDTTLLDYNPIENYDRTEEMHRQTNDTEKTDGTTTNVSSGTTDNITTTKNVNSYKYEHNVVDGGSDSTSGSGGSDGTVSRSAYNETNFSPYETTEGTSHNNQSVTYGKTEKRDEEKNVTEDVSSDNNQTTSNNTTINTDDNVNRSGEENYTLRARGNIGVTTSQQMILQEREVVMFNIYDWIVEKLDKNLFLGVWN